MIGGEDQGRPGDQNRRRGMSLKTDREEALGGAGGGGFHPQSLAILSATYREKRAFALGVHDSSANLGEVIGPLALGLLITFVDWRSALQIWAIPGLVIGLLYALFGAEDVVPAPRRRDYRRALWEDVLKNKTVFSLVAVSTFRAMGQTALSAFLPLYLSLHLKLSAGAVGAYLSLLYFFAGVSPAFVGWIGDRFGHKILIAAFSFSSVAVIVAIPHLGSGPRGTAKKRSMRRHASSAAAPKPHGVST